VQGSLIRWAGIAIAIILAWQVGVPSLIAAVRGKVEDSAKQALDIKVEPGTAVVSKPLRMVTVRPEVSINVAYVRAEVPSICLNQKIRVRLVPDPDTTACLKKGRSVKVDALISYNPSDEPSSYKIVNEADTLAERNGKKPDGSHVQLTINPNKLKLLQPRQVPGENHGIIGCGQSWWDNISGSGSVCADNAVKILDAAVAAFVRSSCFQQSWPRIADAIAEAERGHLKHLVKSMNQLRPEARWNAPVLDIVYAPASPDFNFMLEGFSIEEKDGRTFIVRKKKEDGKEESLKVDVTAVKCTYDDSSLSTAVKEAAEKVVS